MPEGKIGFPMTELEVDEGRQVGLPTRRTQLSAAPHCVTPYSPHRLWEPQP